MKTNSLVFLLFLLIIAIGFPFLFSTNIISGGDYTQPTPIVISFVSNFWSWCGYTGLGFSCAAINLHSTPVWLLSSFLNYLHIPTFLVERILWWIPFFVGGYVSILLLFKKLFPQNKFWFLAPFLYLFNTYILMVIGGGQITGIGLGYAFVPLLFLAFIYLHEKISVEKIVLVGVLLAGLVVIDPRIAFIGYVTCALYATFSFLWNRVFSPASLGRIFVLVLIPAGLAVLLHAYWILPAIVLHQNPLVQLGSVYTTTGAAQFFSFATIENAFGLLHPNWPENLFGFTHFMKPEFLLLPILAFGSLLSLNKKFVHNKENFCVVFLCFLALFGIFLAKGAQDPFGRFYLWIFSNVPGFQLFRDPTKWYLCIAIAYSLLIPFTLQNISESIGNWVHISLKKISLVLILVFTLYAIWLINPLFHHTLTGVFISSQEPREYKELDVFLASQPQFFRTLWVPSTERFGLYSLNHPVIAFTDALPKAKSVSELSHYQKEIEEMDVQYVIVPEDTNGEIFLKDRKYSESAYEHTLELMQKIPWLHKEKIFGKIVVFSVSKPKNHFWLENSSGTVEFIERNPTEYVVNVKNVTVRQKLIFSEAYNTGWTLKRGSTTLHSGRFDAYFNEFSLPQSGSYALTVFFEPQKWVNIGLWVSLATILGVFFTLGLFIARKMLK